MKQHNSERKKKSFVDSKSRDGKNLPIHVMHGFGRIGRLSSRTDIRSLAYVRLATNEFEHTHTHTLTRSRRMNGCATSRDRVLHFFFLFSRIPFCIRNTINCAKTVDELKMRCPMPWRSRVLNNEAQIGESICATANAEIK